MQSTDLMPNVGIRCVFKVAASGYYAWLKRPRSKRAQEEERLQVEIKAAHKRTRGTYGSERLKTDLAEHGVKVGVHRIKRIKKALRIRCKQKKKFKATTDSTHTLPVADNLFDRKFTASEPRLSVGERYHLYRYG